MENWNIIFSFLVISHNQAELIKRCLDSILTQRFIVPWEVVISDDSSTDETWKVIQKYVDNYSEESKIGADGYFIPQFTCSQINSSDYNPAVTSDRCAVNKANVYMHARGKYCANVDADDYIIGIDNYQHLINQLEGHPECSVAMQNMLLLEDGAPIEKGILWWPDFFWKENEILSIEEFCSRRLFISNPAFVMVRDPNLSPDKTYGFLFDDPIISMHHINRGNIICSQKVSYVYIQYNSSIWNQVKNTDNSILRMMTPLLSYLIFFGCHSKHLLQLELSVWIESLKSYLEKNKPLEISPDNRMYIERFSCRLLRNMMNKKKAMHAKIVLFLCLIISKYRLYNRFMTASFIRLIGL